ncbi:DUF6647 family protein [Bradyrhizobium japonicum]|uniref:DUF6647 family protein n=1 Tax=Bradyrhizobium japonicum TaxID=375 RepID=UPI000456DABD|nr:DUF6647 family protein [Bradyrhizobium japonicum]AHY50183.1 hypothetical protein BJS_03023 [Bradyrhizobium japonicum SEMIA 5079]MCD9109077.1 hypothetical protein [Bradyrhizobium japonicum]MCD9259641.1 hypothetical protein [Bradyrhizobium japonicum SEMIA 5079]MCD9820541.1 hypothetical protein [Bradyrhizobium japonicum]MCD9892788.1 hypothetical protein [Bradyrhizobium japonicum]
MFKQFLLVAAIASLTSVTSTKAYCEHVLERGVSAESRSVSLHSDAAQLAEALLDDIVTWLSSNFDLPAIRQRPVVEFASKKELARLRARDRTFSQGFMESDGQLAQREVVALYDNETRTILLPDDWGGSSPADQSVLVHEMVHHLQNVGKLKFDCPQAREKLAYLAQDKWLERFGLTLEHEFDVDMFTVLVSSACMY